MEWIQLSQDRIQRWAIEMNFVVPELRQPASQVLFFMELISFTVTSGTNVKLLPVLLNRISHSYEESVIRSNQ
jgi:hypothetical protein